MLGAIVVLFAKVGRALGGSRFVHLLVVVRSVRNYVPLGASWPTIHLRGQWRLLDHLLLIALDSDHLRNWRLLHQVRLSAIDGEQVRLCCHTLVLETLLR